MSQEISLSLLRLLAELRVSAIWRLDLLMDLSAVSTVSKGSRTAFSSRFQPNLILLIAFSIVPLGVTGGGVGVGTVDTGVEVGVLIETIGGGKKDVEVGTIGKLVDVSDGVGSGDELSGTSSLSLSSSSVAVGVKVGVKVGVDVGVKVGVDVGVKVGVNVGV